MPVNSPTLNDVYLTVAGRHVTTTGVSNFLGLIGVQQSPFEKSIAGFTQYFKGRKEYLMISILVYDGRVVILHVYVGPD
jgi:hypothetical protein